MPDIYLEMLFTKDENFEMPFSPTVISVEKNRLDKDYRQWQQMGSPGRIN